MLSSIFTFLAGKFFWHEQHKLIFFLLGIFIVLIYRLIEFVLSGVIFGNGAQQTGQGQGQPGNKQGPGQPGQTGQGQGQQQAAHGTKQTDQLLDAELKSDTPPPTTGELGWMNEAKDWAGELISGQSTTGRILVS